MQVVITAAVLAVATMIPSVIYVCAGLPYIRMEALTADKGDVDLPLLVSYVLWLFGGFFSLGSLAGEVGEFMFYL
jgi:hypothetical protein